MHGAVHEQRIERAWLSAARRLASRPCTHPLQARLVALRALLDYASHDLEKASGGIGMSFPAEQFAGCSKAPAPSCCPCMPCGVASQRQCPLNFPS